MENIKYILIKNGYREDLIKRVIKPHHNNLHKPKAFGLGKFSAVLKLPCIGETSRLFKNKVKDLTKQFYSQVNTRIIFLSNP